jgi:hypothetical protein
MPAFLWTLGIAAVLVGLFFFVRFWRRTTAPRLVRCPDDGNPYAVELSATHQLAQKLRGEHGLRLQDCSRWPDQADCDQPCREQIATAPDGCRVRSLLDRYYANETCTLCGKEFGPTIDWYQHEPGFIAPDHTVLTWQDVPPERLPETMATYQPLCWDCKILELVRQKHPERVTDRLPH